MGNKTAIMAKQTWLLPFHASGFWVSDARGASVCDCRSTEIAVVIAALLNTQQPKILNQK